MKTGIWMLIAAIYCLVGVVWAGGTSASGEEMQPLADDTITADSLANVIETKLMPNDGAAYDYYGCAVSLDGDTALIGSVFSDGNETQSGSAYVYVRKGTIWSLQAKLKASDGVSYEGFGSSVSLDGDTALVGAVYSGHDGDSPGPGCAYVFVRSGTNWNQQGKLMASDGASWDGFGCTVSLDGGTALVGSSEDDDNGDQSGSAYVFVRNGTTWSQQTKLTASDAAPTDRFGCSVSLSGDTALIGARVGDGNVDNSGCAYAFVRNGTVWSQQAKLTASDSGESDGFGLSVSLNGDTALIGTFVGTGNVDHSGSAYVFVRNGTTWSQQAKLMSSDGAGSDIFGGAVSLDGNTALIGASFDDDHGDNSGSAYVFVRSGTSWSELGKLTASDGAAGDAFGDSVSMDSGTALIGATQYANGSSGAAYLFSGVILISSITHCEPMPGGFMLEWTPIVGVDSVVQCRPSLTSGDFTDLSAPLPYPVNSYTDTVHCADDQCFYRVELQP